MKMIVGWLVQPTIKTTLIIMAISLFSGGCAIQKTQANNSLEGEQKTVGWVENGKIAGIEEEIKFKLDTGATTSSINAEILEQPEEETESGGTIKFRYKDEADVSKIYQLPIVRWVKIESRTKDYIRRPVVRMKLCVAGRWIEEEVNLSNRDDFNYSVLVGRNMLAKGKLAIDSAKTFTVNPSCPIEEAQS